jgi:Bacterial SH3 domain
MFGPVVYEPPEFRFPWMDEIERLRRQLEEFTAPARAAGDLFSQLRSQYGFMDESSFYEELTAPSRRMQEAAAAVFSNLVREYQIVGDLAKNDLLSSIAPQLTGSLEAVQFSGFPFAEALHREIEVAARGPQWFSDFHASFAGQLLSAAAEIDQAPEEARAEKARRLLELLRKVGKHVGGYLAQHLLEITLALGPWLENKISDQHSREMMSSEIRAVRAEISRRDERPAGDLRVVTVKRLHVRSNAGGQSAIVGRLTTNTLVRILKEEASGWARVEYFDFVTAEIKSGWVALRFLERLPDAMKE